jgi:outer membrane protein TolC
LTGSGRPSLGERTNLLLGTSASYDLVWPGKLAAQGRSALAAARAAGFHFDQMRGELRSKVVRAYVEVASNVEEQTLARDGVRLLASLVAVLEPRISSGVASGAELARAQADLALADNDFQALAAKEPQLRAELNAVLGRNDPTLPLVVTMPEPRMLPFPAERVLDLLWEHNPELKEHGLEVLAARENLAARKLDGVPELSLAASIGKAVQTLGAAVALPFLREAALSGSIAEAEAKLAEADAFWRQMQSDMAADAQKTLALYRDAERQVERFQTAIVPAAERAYDLVRTSYAGGEDRVHRPRDGAAHGHRDQASRVAYARDADRQPGRARTGGGASRARAGGRGDAALTDKAEVATSGSLGIYTSLVTGFEM